MLRQVVQGNPKLLANFSTEEKALLDVTNDGQVDEADIAALCRKLIKTAQPPLQHTRSWRIYAINFANSLNGVLGCLPV